jgi:hemerythrin-like domain-containing protein
MFAMDQKPIKRNPHIVKLSKDHHFTLLFCWKIRNGLKFEAEPSRIKMYIQYFWKYHMQPHFREEETILFAPVKDEAVKKALKEHADIAQQINNLNANEHISPGELLTLADMVDNHVRYEERELFPHMEKVLSEEQLESIGKQIEEHHDPGLKDDFADEFWIKKKV